MAYPSGPGSERLMRGVINAQSGSDTAFTFDGTNPTVGTDSYTVPALHIITVISIIICNAEPASAYNIDMGVTPSGDTAMQLLKDQNVNGSGTFIWNDKFVLHGGDKLSFRSNANTSGDIFDIYISFIDQNWEN